MNRNVMSFLAILITLVVSIDFGNAQDKGPATIRLSMHVPETHMVWQKTLLPWVKLVEEEAKGKIVLKTYLGGVLHAASDGFKAVRGDITDLTMCSVPWEPGGFHLNHVFGLPFLFPDATVASAVAEELYPKYLKEEYERKEVYLACFTAAAPANILTNKPVKTLADLKGLKLRTAAGPVAEVIKNLGATPVSMSIAENYTALQRGIIDGSVSPDFGSLSYRLYEVSPYLLELNIDLSMMAFGLNRKTFNAMSPEQKKLFYNLLRQQGIIMAVKFDEENKDARKTLIEKGVKVTTLTPKEMETWKEASKADHIVNKFIEENEALGLPAKNLMKDLTALTKTYSAMKPEEILKKAKEHPIQGIIKF